MDRGNHSQPLDLAYLQINSCNMTIRDTVNNLDLPIGEFKDVQIQRFDSKPARHMSYLGGQSHTDAIRRTGNHYRITGKISEIRNLDNWKFFITGGVDVDEESHHTVTIEQLGVPFFGLNNYPIPAGPATLNALPIPRAGDTPFAVTTTGGSGWTATDYVAKIEALYAAEDEISDAVSAADGFTARRSAGVSIGPFTIANATDKVALTIKRPLINGNTVKTRGYAVWVKTAAGADSTYALVAITDNPATLTFNILSPTALADTPSYTAPASTFQPRIKYGANFASTAIEGTEQVYLSATREIRRAAGSPVPEGVRSKLEYARLWAPQRNSALGTVNPHHGYHYIKLDETGSDMGSDNPASEGLVVLLYQVRSDIADASMGLSPDAYSEGFEVQMEAVLARYPETGYGRVYGFLDKYAAYALSENPETTDGTISVDFGGDESSGGDSTGLPFGG